jgi:hypothetical protein
MWVNGQIDLPSPTQGVNQLHGVVADTGSRAESGGRIDDNAHRRGCTKSGTIPQEDNCVCGNIEENVTYVVR